MDEARRLDEFPPDGLASLPHVEDGTLNKLTGEMNAAPTVGDWIMGIEEALAGTGQEPLSEYMKYQAGQLEAASIKSGRPVSPGGALRLGFALAYEALRMQAEKNRERDTRQSQN